MVPSQRQALRTEDDVGDIPEMLRQDRPPMPYQARGLCCRDHRDPQLGPVRQLHEFLRGVYYGGDLEKFLWHRMSMRSQNQDLTVYPLLLAQAYLNVKFPNALPLNLYHTLEKKNIIYIK